MANRQSTNLYVSLPVEDDEFIDSLRQKKIREEKKHFTKNDTAKYLIGLGIDVERGNYIRINPSYEEFIAKMQVMYIEMPDGERVAVKKSKQEIVEMLIAKGLQHLND